MHILHTTAVNQTIAFIPRAYVGIVNVDLYDTNRKSTISFSASTIAEDGYLKITNSYSLEEGIFIILMFMI